MTPNPKPGFTTTEFWIVGLVILLTMGGCFGGVIPPSIASSVSVLMSLCYAVLRALVKSDHNTQFTALVQTLLDAQQIIHPLPIVGPDMNGQARTANDTLIHNENPPAVAAAPAGISPAAPVGGAAGGPGMERSVKASILAGHASMDVLCCIVIFIAAVAFLAGCSQRSSAWVAHAPRVLASAPSPRPSREDAQAGRPSGHAGARALPRFRVTFPDTQPEPPLLDPDGVIRLIYLHEPEKPFVILAGNGTPLNAP